MIDGNRRAVIGRNTPGNKVVVVGPTLADKLPTTGSDVVVVVVVVVMMRTMMMSFSLTMNLVVFDVLVEMMVHDLIDQIVAMSTIIHFKTITQGLKLFIVEIPVWFSTRQDCAPIDSYR